MYNLKLQWRNFNISLERVEAWIEANIQTQISGTSAGSDFMIHFLEEPSQEEIEMIQEYWDGLKKSSQEVKNYKSEDDIKSDREDSKQSALNKLKEIAGLNKDEVEALLKG